MDIIYPYKRSPGDFELRYSLRSVAAYVPHDRVIIAGDIPSGLSDRVHCVRNARYDADRYISSTANILAAMTRADVSADFIVMNDDIFVLKPWTFRHQHRAPIAQLLDDPSFKGDYRSRMVSTAGLLRSIGIADPLFYSLHTPTIYNRAKMAAMLSEYPMPKYKYLTRTLYHNLYPQPSIQTDDVKVKSWPLDSEPGDILSISDGVARSPDFMAWINGRFPAASVYEAL